MTTSILPLTFTAEEYFGDLCSVKNFQQLKDGFEEYWYWPGEVSEGLLYVTKLRPGLILCITDHRSTAPIRITFAEHGPFLSLSFILSGNGWTNFYGGQYDKQKISLSPSSCYLAYFPKCSGVSLLDVQPYLHISLYIEPWFLRRYIETSCPLHSFIEGIEACPDSVPYYFRQFSFTSLINMKLHEIRSCPHGGGRRRCFLESRTLDLVFLATGQLCGVASEEHTIPFSCCKNYPFVEQTRNILLNSMAAPPSLAELSRCVGVNKTKLNTCFRETYGTSIFEYLRICRLERAKLLLQSGQKSVSEIALEVGYSEQSNFSKQFKKYFGASPRDYTSGLLSRTKNLTLHESL